MGAGDGVGADGGGDGAGWVWRCAAAGAVRRGSAAGGAGGALGRKGVVKGRGVGMVTSVKIRTGVQSVWGRGAPSTLHRWAETTNAPSARQPSPAHSMSPATCAPVSLQLLTPPPHLTPHRHRRPPVQVPALRRPVRPQVRLSPCYAHRPRSLPRSDLLSRHVNKFHARDPTPYSLLAATEHALDGQQQTSKLNPAAIQRTTGAGADRHNPLSGAKAILPSVVQLQQKGKPEGTSQITQHPAPAPQQERDEGSPAQDARISKNKSYADDYQFTGW